MSTFFTLTKLAAAAKLESAPGVNVKRKGSPPTGAQSTSELLCGFGEHALAQVLIAVAWWQIVGDDHVALISTRVNRAKRVTGHQGQLPIVAAHGDTRVPIIDDSSVGNLVSVLQPARRGNDERIAEFQVLQKFEVRIAVAGQYRVS